MNKTDHIFVLILNSVVGCKSYPSTFTLTLSIRVGDSLPTEQLGIHCAAAGVFAKVHLLTGYLSASSGLCLKQATLLKDQVRVSGTRKRKWLIGEHTPQMQFAFVVLFFIHTSPASTQDVWVSLLIPCR